MLKKKMKGVAMDASPSFTVVDEEARTRFFKHQGLMQDYNELFKETEEKRKKIQIAKRRRRILLAEVRFLRQRYEELMDYQSQEQRLARAQTHRDAILPEKSRKDREAAVLPNPTPVLDLNQMANEEEEEIEAQNTCEPVRMEKSVMKFPVSKGGKPPLPPRQKDLKLSVCRDIRKGSSKTGKRKISLQDPVALRV